MIDCDWLERKLTIYDFLLFTGQYQGPDAFGDAYGHSPHHGHGSYDSSPPFQTVPTPDHWSSGGGVNGMNGGSGGNNTPVDMLSHGHPGNHPAYHGLQTHLGGHRNEQLPHHHNLNHHTHISADLKPVIQPGMLSAYGGELRTLLKFN